MVPGTISHYRILEELGTGGTGIVYRAQDLRLGRTVAVKLLPPEVVGDPQAMQRFLLEARIASLLTHPHICAVHDVGEQDGRPFIVMEFLDGDAIDHRLADGPAPVPWLLDVAIQVAEGLEAAHRRGVVHGHLKPSNIFVNASGDAKIVDFGLTGLRRAGHAAPVSSSSTTSWTPGDLVSVLAAEAAHPYVAPEQLLGQPPDGRADLFAFGAILYELATGRQAFGAPAPAAVRERILRDLPPPPSGLNPEVFPELEQIIAKALEKDPALRYQDAADLVADLRRARRRIDATPTPQPAAPGRTPPPGSGPGVPRPSRRRPWLLPAGLLVVCLLTVGLFLLGSRQSVTLSERDSILLAGVTNATGDPVFDDTLRQALTVQLSQSPFLDVVPDERMREGLRLMGRAGELTASREVNRDLCQRLGVKAMLEGSIAMVGSVYLVTLEATECETGDVFAREQAQVAEKEAVLRSVGALASSMRTRLGESLALLERFDVPIEQATTPSLDALKAYTLGADQRARGNELQSIPFFQRAIELDPGFAAAHTMLSTVYGSIGETEPSARYARLAYELRERVSERERLFIAFQYHDRITEDQFQAIQTLRVWKESYPRDYRPANALALTLARLGQFERAIDEAREAVRRNPAHPFPYSNLAYALRGAGRFDEAKAVALEAAGRQIETLPMRRLLYQLSILEGDETAAAAHLDWARGNAREFDMVGARAAVAASRGRMTEARDLYARTIEMAQARGFPEIAAGYRAQVALTELAYGYEDRALHSARTVVQETASTVPRLRAAAVLGLGGATREASALVAEAERGNASSTLLQNVHLPIARAALALGASRPEAALEALRPAQPFELGFTAELLPPYLRGEAFLRIGDAAQAARQFEAVLTHRGTDPFSVLQPLARLGLARAARLAGDAASVREAYERLFEHWRTADESLPVLRSARAEYAQLAP